MLAAPPVTGAALERIDPPLDEAEIVAAAHRMQLGHGGAVASRLLRVLTEPELSLGDMVRHIGAEPSVAIRVLRVANSAFYGQPARVASLARASQVLGSQTLRGVAMAACFDGLSVRERGRAHVHMEALRRHSLATACAAQELARCAAPALVDQAFMAGLLHDLGMLLLWRLRPATAPLAVRETEMPGGLGHADCGRVLMQQWSLPDELTQAVATHDDMFAGQCGSTTSIQPHLCAGPGVVATVAPPPPREPGLGRLLGLAEAMACDAGFMLAGDAACTLPLPGEPLHEACASAAALFPAEALRLIDALAA